MAVRTSSAAADVARAEAASLDAAVDAAAESRWVLAAAPTTNLVFEGGTSRRRKPLVLHKRSCRVSCGGQGGGY